MASAGDHPYLPVGDGVVVDPHLWVDVLQIPLEAAAAQLLAEGDPLRHVSKVHAWVLPWSQSHTCWP